MNFSVYRSRTMTIPKNTIGSHVSSVFSRSTSRPIGTAAEALKPEAVVYAGRMGEALPLPPRLDLGRIGDVWRVDYETRFREARAWALRHDIPAAARDERRICLLVVDAQNTFCTPGFELFVAGRSGTGALDDSRRLCEFLYRNLAAITETVVTLDTHQAFQLFHAPLLVDRDGRHPEPYTLVAAEDVASGRWRVDPDAAEVLGLDPQRAGEHLRAYVDALAAGGKYDLTIWPFHAMLGGIGHALVSAIEEGLFFHAITRRAQTRIEIKGRNPLTEHYSVLGPEVLEGARGEALGERNAALVRHLLGFDAVVVAGQAKSHCVAWTIGDLLADAPEIAPRLYLLEDCSSAVVVPGVVDYTDDADRAFASFSEAGAHVVRSTDPLAVWPGPIGAVAVR
jgi:nicotinamidase-related amidase